MPGQHVGRPLNGTRGPAYSFSFQSPRCRGSMSDFSGRTVKTISSNVSIPAMPGQHVGHRLPPRLGRRAGLERFNPRDAGAACRTARGTLGTGADRRFNPRDAGAACRTSFVQFQRPCWQGFNPRDAGAACRTKPVPDHGALPERFQSPRCRGSMSDRARVCARQPRDSRFQSPRCRGSMSDSAPAWRSGNAARAVSIPAMPGQHVGPDGAGQPRRAAGQFQSPRCRGSMSDGQAALADEGRRAFQSPRCRGSMSDTPRFPWLAGALGPFQSPRCRGSMSDDELISRGVTHPVSIPAMPGQHVGRRARWVGLLYQPERFQSPRCRGSMSDWSFLSRSEKEMKKSFNPRDAGAACRTGECDRPIEACSGVFQSPRCRGSMSDASSPTSIRSRGHSFQSPRCRGSMSDLRLQHRPVLRRECFNPRDAGAACRTRLIDERERAREQFQSPRCRGSMSDTGRRFRGRSHV